MNAENTFVEAKDLIGANIDLTAVGNNCTVECSNLVATQGSINVTCIDPDLTLEQLEALSGFFSNRTKSGVSKGVPLIMNPDNFIEVKCTYGTETFMVQVQKGFTVSALRDKIAQRYYAPASQIELRIGQTSKFCV